MGIFFFFIIIVLFLLFFASSIVFSIIRWVLSLLGIGAGRGNGHHDTSGTQRRGSTGEGYNESAQSSSGDDGQWHYSPEEAHKRRKRKKIISSDEGEYVDFEEIK